MEISIWSILFFGFAYLLGSVPFGLILTRAAGMGDIRTMGSGNIGTTNVLRAGSKRLAAGTLILDALKGMAAVTVGTALFGPLAGAIAGVCAFLGHLYPIWLKFKGGKGVATFIGVLAGLSWQGFLVFAVCWLVVAFLFRFSSLSALVASVITTLLLLVTGQQLVGITALILTAMVYWKHRTNIQKLIAGTESKIGQ